MNILIDDETSLLEKEPKILELIENVVKATLNNENFPQSIELSIMFTTDEVIKEINFEHRGIDKITDVLSFPQIDWSSYNIDIVDKNIETGDIILGDIVICVERALEQSKEYGHSFQREIGFLVAHSMLHLLGYDHMEKNEEEKMIKKQEKILRSLGLVR